MQIRNGFLFGNHNSDRAEVTGGIEIESKDSTRYSLATEAGHGDQTSVKPGIPIPMRIAIRLFGYRCYVFDADTLVFEAMSFLSYGFLCCRKERKGCRVESCLLMCGNASGRIGLHKEVHYASI